MKYFIDTGDMQEITKWIDYIEGITTNPILLKEKKLKQFLQELNGFEKTLNIFIQIHTWKEYEELDLLKRSLHLRDNITAKVPLIYPQGYELIRKIKKETINTPVCGTVTYDLVQLQRACALNCDYCIVLFAKNENPHFLEEAAKLQQMNKYKTKLIGASFRTKNDVKRALLSGIHYSTLSPKVFELAFNNVQANKDWREIYE
jgi:transaldolase